MSVRMDIVRVLGSLRGDQRGLILDFLGVGGDGPPDPAGAAPRSDPKPSPAAGPPPVPTPKPPKK